mmetsp:Transcript_20166/g.58304  ORF Transcript_20166/g.58304 Transcript_20166/m.58304 type:complete len:352 (+) Transcript_20166:903-1958(+)
MKTEQTFAWFQHKKSRLPGSIILTRIHIRTGTSTKQSQNHKIHAQLAMPATTIFGQLVHAAFGSELSKHFYPWRSLIFCASHEPTKKEGHQRNNRCGNPAPARKRAGPGQRPPIPQPSPKIASPKIRLASIILFVGTLNFPTDFFIARGHDRAFEFFTVVCPATNWYPIQLIKKPPPITQTRVGSHVPLEKRLKSKKPYILNDLTIWLIAKPIEKTDAERDAGPSFRILLDNRSCVMVSSLLSVEFSLAAFSRLLGRRKAGMATPTEMAVITAPIRLVRSVGYMNCASDMSPRRYGDKGQVGEQAVADRIPVSIKEHTPTKDRLERRARPQIPCPVVQPFPSLLQTGLGRD